MSSITMPALITNKRDGKELSTAEIEYFIKGVVEGEVQGSQLGAMLMAIYMKGMTLSETTSLTQAMKLSGETLHWPEEWRGLVVDKHSTGGVGDKVSLPLAPALAAAGLKVPMISGRGLGFTGGTLDKLESIPGFQVAQSPDRMRDILTSVGCCIVGQTKTLVPADKIMYAERDVTATVGSIPLISGSIISKKAAEDLSALVMDVKMGKGAFLKTEEEARTLAKTLVAVSNSLGVNTAAVLSRMDSPVGKTVGNALEVAEALDCLHHRGPPALHELVTVLGGHLLYNVGRSTTPGDGARELERLIQNGSALAKFQAMLIAQGVSPEVATKLCDKDTDVWSILPKAQHVTALNALTSGYVFTIDSLECALVSGELGAGRVKAGQPIDHAVGLQLHVSVGDQITKGDPWVTVHHNSPLPPNVEERLYKGINITEKSIPGPESLIVDVISG